MTWNQIQPQESNQGNGSVAAPVVVTNELPWATTINPLQFDPNFNWMNLRKQFFVEFVWILER